MKWYDEEISQVVESLKTDLERGLASEDARARLAEHGANELAEVSGPGAIRTYSDGLSSDKALDRDVACELSNALETSEIFA